MADSQQSDSNVNTYPERRRKRIEENGETSPFFGPSKTKKTGDDAEYRETRQRQAVLSISNGRITHKKPLINPQSRDDPRRTPLKEIAAETKNLLPGLLATRPDVTSEGHLYRASQGLELDEKHCPRLSTKVRVINSDTIDAALGLIAPSAKPPCVLNMANAQRAGGGWEHGALAQEEALCYRTSLSFTLKLRHYPLPDLGGIYSPHVMVIRENMSSGHGLLDFREPSKLGVISAVSVAAVCNPETTKDGAGLRDYARQTDKEMMQKKIRLILRIATRNGHTQLVLGAFGCGAFGNPKEEVASMFASILTEREFQSGWWETVVFAVLDNGNGNFNAFHAVLDGLKV